MDESAARDGSAAAPSPWPRRLFWGWQAFYGLLFAVALLGLLLEEYRLAGPGLVAALTIPVGLAPLLGPAWLPVTAVLGMLMVLSRRRGRRAG